MSNAHPTPWRAEFSDDGAAGVIDANGAIVMLYRRATDEQKANALLYAASHDLLGALRELQANPNDPRAHRSALDAIAAATGASHEL